MIQRWLLLFFIPTLALASEVKLLTWNTFLIPPPWNITKQKQRTQLMVKELPALDHEVMFFQEAFYDSQRNKLIKALRKTLPYVAVPRKGRKLWQIQDSGLFVMSKHPMKFLGLKIFSDCAKTDCLSSKSAMLVEVSFPDGKVVQFVNTHLQAWNEPKTFEVRKRQLTEIKELLSQHAKPGVAQILVGDLNIDGKLPEEYQASLQLMNMSSAPLIGTLSSSNGFSTEGCYKKPGEDGEGEWLDHFWVSENYSTTVIRDRKVLPLHGELNGRDCPLSDHYAVESVLSL